MEFIHDFWIEMCPMFINYGFIYVFLDFLTLFALLYMVVILPGQLLLGGNKKLWND